MPYVDPLSPVGVLCIVMGFYSLFTQILSFFQFIQLLEDRRGRRLPDALHQALIKIFSIFLGTQALLFLKSLGWLRHGEAA